ncbi:uncharacterized protein LOC127087287 isoform X2 [Lathyrus oleraceus]|uniref:uncharacterized protein LOC127087287 isoform X2 n=1 Tax=Pisum sativum TaxID=3888 RepID=UPI0021CFF8FE|nr:uncharacterized protein LOC127087287 isoform X2 [Pisum sativum]
MLIAKGLVSIVVIIALILPQISPQAVSTSAADNATEEIRQKDNTIRVDPLENFTKYRGGFNISNKNYWSSLIFTGVYGYGIGMLFLLCGILYGVFLVIAKFCYRENDEGGKRMKKVLFPCNYKTCDVLLILLVLFLMLIAIVATGLVLVGSVRFHSEAKISVDIIIETANEASETIHNTTEALKGMENSLMEANVNIEASSNLDSTAEKLDDASENIEMQARKNRRLINKGLKIVFVTTIVIMCLNLLAVTVLSVCGVLRLRRSLYIFSSDACIALDNFQENPYNNSLSSILPCQELLKAKPVLSEFSSGIYHLVNEVNANLSMQAASYPNPVHVCNPFSEPPNYFYQPENCPENAIRIGDIPKVLKSGNFMTNSEYARVETYTNSIQDLLNVYPSMEHLLECQIVKDAFSQVLVHHCKPMKKYGKMAWVGMVFLGVVMVLLILLWTMKASFEHCYHVSDGSVKPQE